MSDTLSIDVVGPSYWTYMATVMADCLERISISQEVLPNSIPSGVYRDAKSFFGLVMQSAGKDLPENPPASLNAYVIAAYAVKESSDEEPKTLESLAELLEDYSTLLNRLDRPGELNEHEVNTAKDLQQFFRELAQAGEAEIYERTVDYFEPAFSNIR
jgi:hypothetical protein